VACRLRTSDQEYPRWGPNQNQRCLSNTPAKRGSRSLDWPGALAAGNLPKTLLLRQKQLVHFPSVWTLLSGFIRVPGLHWVCRFDHLSGFVSPLGSETPKECLDRGSLRGRSIHRPSVAGVRIVLARKYFKQVDSSRLRDERRPLCNLAEWIQIGERKYLRQ